jgi:Flp pilus assembly protein TadG
MFEMQKGDRRNPAQSLHLTSSIPAMIRNLSNDAGNVGMIFAMLLAPTTAFVGMSIDYSRAFNAKSELQMIVDAATLKAAQNYQTTGDASASIQIARDWFSLATLTQSTTGSAAMKRAVLDAAYVNPSGEVTMSASVKVQTTFMRLLNIEDIASNVTSEASVPVDPLDVEMALVFDVTGSMGDPMPIAEPDGSRKKKIDVAKASATAMLDIMMPDTPRTNKIRMSLIPFSQTVNIGNYVSAATGQPASVRYDAGSWQWKCIRYTGSGNNKTCAESGYVWVSNWKTKYRKNCTYERLNSVASHGYDDALPANTSTYFPATWTSNAQGQDTECTPTDRLVPLTDDKDRLVDAVNDITVTGGTAGHIGAAWGWYTVSPNWSSFWPAESQPEEHDMTKRIKAVVIMSDGDFNYAYKSDGSGVQNSFPSGGNNTSAEQAKAVCNNMKAQGFEVFTVAVGVVKDSSGYKSLENCASGPNYMFQQHFYYVVKSSEFARAFQDIATKVSRATVNSTNGVRLSK